MTYTKRQIEILNAATKLINEGGIQHLTTKALADEMKFSEPALYRHFKNKTEILYSLLEYFGQTLKSRIDDLMDGEETGRQKLERIIEFQFAHFSQHPAIVMVIFAETSFQYEEKLSDAVRDIMTNKRNRLIQIMKDGQKDGSIRKDVDSGQLASVFMGSMRFTILRWRLDGYSHDLIKEGKALWKTFEALLNAPKK